MEIDKLFKIMLPFRRVRKKETPWSQVSIKLQMTSFLEANTTAKFMQWLLQRTNSACDCCLLITADTPLLLLAIALALSYTWARQCYKSTSCFSEILRTWFTITAPVCLPCTCTESKNVSWMVGFSCSKFASRTQRSRISLLA